MDNLKVMLAAIVVLLIPSVACAGDTGEQVVIGRVVDGSVYAGTSSIPHGYAPR